MAPTTRSAAKRRRIESTQPQNALPSDALLLAFGFLDRADVASLCRVSSSLKDLVLHSDGSAELWRDLAVRSCGPVMAEIWESLRGTTVRMARAYGDAGDAVAGGDDDDDDAKKNQPPQEQLMTDSELWRRILQSRETMLRKPGLNEPNGALETYREFYSTVWSREPRARFPLCDRYDFAVHLWDESGEKLSEARNLFFPYEGDELKLRLDKSTAVAKLLQSGRFRALEIEVRRCTPWNQQGWSVVYSSPSPLVDAYGGAAFEEYSSVAWFEYEGEGNASLQAQRLAAHIPERYGWLPFFKSPELEVVAGRKYGIQLNLCMEWRCRNQTGRIGEEYTFAQSMSMAEMIVFFANRCYGPEHESGKEPRCYSLTSKGSMSPVPAYLPRDLSAYSFLIDFKDTRDSSDCRTIFYESVDADAEISASLLGLKIPPSDFNAILPRPEDGVNESRDDLQIDKTFTIYSIDRKTGKQSKLLETTGFSKLRSGDFFLTSKPFFSFERFAALMKYSASSNVNGIPLPYTQSFLTPIWEKDDGESAGSADSPMIVISFRFLSWNKNPLEGRSPIDTVRTGQKGVLTFLEKGLIYE